MIVVFCDGRARLSVQNSDDDDDATKGLRSRRPEERKDPNERERERETFSERERFERMRNHSFIQRTGYLQHRLKRRGVRLLFHQTRERVRGQTRGRSVRRHLGGLLETAVVRAREL